jgi:hypothetical protein
VGGERAGDPVVDSEPLAVGAAQLDSLIEHGKKRNFITHVDSRSFPSEGSKGRAGEQGAGKLVRVSCKIDPFNTQIEFPLAWSSWKKSSMGRSKDAQSWTRMGAPVAMSSSVDAEEFHRVAIFVQPPRIRVGRMS